MSWLPSWKGRVVIPAPHAEMQNRGVGVVINDRSPKRPISAHRYVDVLWAEGTLEEEVHTSDLRAFKENNV
jgi:hypothetical protein